MAINETHDPKLKSWVESANDPATDFPIQNLPFFVFGRPDMPECDQFLGTRVGDAVIDLEDLGTAGLFDAIGKMLPSPVPIFPWNQDVFCCGGGGRINKLATFDGRYWAAVRRRLVELFGTESTDLRGNQELRAKAVFRADEVPVHKPAFVYNYTDFYASIHHATTVGSMFRPDNPLLPNYKHVPIGYHGRASSIVISGTDIRRPRGQIPPPDDKPQQGPTFGPSRMLDYELEVGAFVGPGNNLGEPIMIGDAEKHIFGLCLVNDWSARDMQKWEYQPLGPFLAKNFATTVSPYVVTLEALEPFRCPAYRRPEGDPAPLDYLHDDANESRGGFDITLEVWLRTAEMERRSMSPVLLSKSNAFKEMYWTVAQLLTHHTSNGCNLQTGDLLASGTVSGRGPTERGCLLELTWQGRGPDGKPLPRKPIDLPTGEKRTFLEDGDEVIFKGYCEREGFRRIGFGECRGKIAPALG
ncbi:MAG: fumarylacetoacetase [Phycisphaerales bacterium]